MTTIATKPASTYAAAYAQLTAIAERLKGAGTASSIDTLADDVRAARQIYATLKCIIDTIRAEIDAEIGTAHEGAAVLAG